MRVHVSNLTFTCALETLQRGGEALGPGQEVVLELGQAFAFRHPHADLMLLLREAGALAVQQELKRGNNTLVIYTHPRKTDMQSSLACFRRFSSATGPLPHELLQGLITQR